VSVVPDLKAALRGQAKARRAAAHAAAPGAGDRLIAAFAATGVAVTGRVVAGYMAIHTEINPAALLRDCEVKKARLALPRTPPRGAEGPVTFHAWTVSDHVERGPYGVPQVSEHSAKVVPEVVFVPLLAFDRRGSRLGYGKGHYDRAIAALPRRPVLIGLAYDEQRFEALPQEPHDLRMDWIVTPSGAYLSQEI
jgi:5-formyltetrahydrofolate cyclo-ligase